ncbi:hypothetical protein D7D52_34780 [Nocardia yunnanensis]|uniref:Centromere-binding protein ParB C-terminal domain-containing protein n=1 Tax=Nocardia yunnanensis TaxID=2382165 RepID=A0A386ZKK4_9NOCA|nr:hypothetical protein [Nocardia yunnanensis]AYF78137.1 hypothetical protein D7D52_34780 [Nocardia yunnanensis]
MSNKLPNPLGDLPDPAEAKAARNPFARHDSAPETPAAPADDSSDEQDTPSATTAPRGSSKSAGKSGKAGEESERSKRLAGSSDILLSLPTDLKDRMERVIAYTRPYTGVDSQQEFIRRAVAKACAEHEGQYHNGERFPAIVKPERKRKPKAS